MCVRGRDLIFCTRKTMSYFTKIDKLQKCDKDKFTIVSVIFQNKASKFCNVMTEGFVIPKKKTGEFVNILSNKPP